MINRNMMDEASMSRMLGVPVTQIPESVLTEYEQRLRWFHADGHSGPLGTIGIIDMLRSLGCKPKPKKLQEAVVDWSRVAMDGTVRVLANVKGGDGKEAWASGVYCGQVGAGALAIRLDGESYVHEVRRVNVRIAREEPMELQEAPVSKDESEGVPTDPWESVEEGQPVMVELDDDLKEGEFQGVIGDELLILFPGDVTTSSFKKEQVTCLGHDPAMEQT